MHCETCVWMVACLLLQLSNHLALLDEEENLAEV